MTRMADAELVDGRLHTATIAMLLLLVAAPLPPEPEPFLHGTVGVRVALPSTDEQISIVDFLDRETAKIDALVAKIETAIERLQEHRTALITAAVTGKIDVRGTVVREEDAA